MSTESVPTTIPATQAEAASSGVEAASSGAEAASSGAGTPKRRRWVRTGAILSFLALLGHEVIAAVAPDAFHAGRSFIGEWLEGPSAPSTITAKIYALNGVYADSASVDHIRTAIYLRRGTTVHVHAYCIGPPTREPQYPRSAEGVYDERWLLLQGGLLTPAWAAYERLPIGLPRLPCPRALSSMRGPSQIHLFPQNHQAGVTLLAVSPSATSIGFAVYDSATRKWQALAVVRASKEGDASTTLRVTQPTVALAAACWATGDPAQPEQAAVASAIPLDRPPRRLWSEASQAEAAGAISACESEMYGPPVAHRLRNIRKSRRAQALAPEPVKPLPPAKVQTVHAGGNSRNTPTTTTKAMPPGVGAHSPRSSRSGAKHGGQPVIASGEEQTQGSSKESEGG
jgi:hypothetical protein